MQIRLIFLAIYALSNSVLLAQKPELRFPLHTSGGFSSLAFSADGKKILAATDTDVRIWDVNSGLMVQSTILGKGVIGAKYIPGHSGIMIHYTKAVYDLLFHWDGKSKEVQSAGDEGWIGFSANGTRGYYRLYNRLSAWDQDMDSFRDLEINIGYNSTYPSPIDDNTVYEVQNKYRNGEGTADTAHLTSITLEPKSKNLVTSTVGFIEDMYWVKNKQEALVQIRRTENDQTIQSFRLLNYSTGQWGQNVANIKSSKIDKVQVSADGSKVYILTKEWQQYLLDFNEKTIIQQISPVPVSKPDFEIPNSFYDKAFQYTEKGELLAVFPVSRQKAEVWSLWERKKLWELNFRTEEKEVFFDPSEQIAFSKDGQYLLHGNKQGQIHLMDSQSGAMVQTFISGKMHQLSNLGFAENYQLDVLTTDTSIWQFDLNKLSFASTASSTVFQKPIQHLKSPHYNDEETFSQDSTWKASWYNDPEIPQAMGINIQEVSSGKVIKVPPANERSMTKAACFSTDNSLVIMGTQDNIIRVARTADGTIQHTFQGHQAEILALAISKDNKIVASLSKDQSEIKLWDLTKGMELASIFLFDRGDYAVISPNGIFDASPGTMQNLYFTVEDEIIDLEQLKELYWVPNLLKKLLTGKAPREIRDVKDNALDEFYPSVTAEIEKDNLIINIEERKGGFGPLHLYINGTLVNKNLNRRQDSRLEVSLEKYGKHFYTGRPNSISLQSFNKKGWMKSRPIKLAPYTPGFPIRRDHKLAHLYAIVVGTSEYEGSQLDLSYAGKDAVSLHKALSIAGVELFKDRTDIRLFTTDQVPNASLPTKSNIQKAINEITSKAEPIDLVLMYFAGHRKAIEKQNNKSHFYYLTQSMRSFRQLENPQARDLDAISQEELTDWLSEMAAKKRVLILDACNSGELVNSLIEGRNFTESQLVALDRMKDRTGMYILAGSAADRKSFEASEFGQGLLTYSLLQGMQELSIKDPNDEVDILQLLMYAENQVPELAKNLGVTQKPKMYNQEGLSSFPIGIVKDPADIPLEKAKPFFMQPLLLQEGALIDPLELVPRLEDQFQKYIRKGADFTYRAIHTNKNGYSIRGMYTIQGKEVEINATLFRGIKEIGPLNKEKAPLDKLDELLEEIIIQAEELIE
ncbi:MAG: caspase family protein [Saprospiraceae bacterium]|nr:caspase family protein [Saprospiraceae bacterium]